MSRTRVALIGLAAGFAVAVWTGDAASAAFHHFEHTSKPCASQTFTFDSTCVDTSRVVVKH